MDVAREMEFTPNQLERVNCVRLWFNVQYLSELSNEDGTAIRYGIKNGSHFPRCYVRKSDGPNQKRPNKRSWLFWKKLINTFTKTDKSTVLKHKLGKWTKDHSKHGRWPIYEYENKVYEYCITEMNEEKWIVYYKYGTQLRYEDELNYDEFDHTIATPTKIQLMSNGTRYSVKPVQVEATDTLIQYGPITTWEDFLSRQSPWMQDLLEDV